MVHVLWRPLAVRARLLWSDKRANISACVATILAVISLQNWSSTLVIMSLAKFIEALRVRGPKQTCSHSAMQIIEQVRTTVVVFKISQRQFGFQQRKIFDYDSKSSGINNDGVKLLSLNDSYWVTHIFKALVLSFRTENWNDTPLSHSLPTFISVRLEFVWRTDLVEPALDLTCCLVTM